MSDTTSDRLVERQDLPLVERLEDAAMVLATAPLRIDAEAGNALATDCAEGAAEIRRLEEELDRHLRANEKWAALAYDNGEAMIRYLEALEKIAKILEDDDLQSASKVARAHEVIRHWRENEALEADHE